MKHIDKNKIRSILVVRTDRIGEALLNIPAIRALKQSFNSYVTVLVNPVVRELLEDIPEIDEIMLFDEQQWNKGFKERLLLRQQLRKKKFDLAVILNPTKRFHILTYLSGIPWRLGYARKWGFLLTHRIKDEKSLGKKHEVEYNLDLVRSISADTNDLDISIPVEKNARQFVEALLLKYGIKDKDTIIAIHPYSSNPAKCWTKGNFARLAEELYSRFAAKIVIVGGKEERDSATRLVSLTKSSLVNLTGSLTLKQLAAFLQKCALLISNDSGPVHIAAAVNTPTVVIFGRNIPGVGPKRWRPWGDKHIVLHKDPGCNPCLDRSCPYEFKCLTSITPEEVMQAVENSLAHRLQLKAHENPNC